MSNPLVLMLERDNPCNTTIVNNETGELMYTVTTVHEKDSFTYLKDAKGGHIAHWKWRDIRSDVLTMGDAKPIPAGDWLQKSMVPFSSTVSFKDNKKRTFKWKNVEGGGQMELYSSEDKKNPVAAFLKSLDYKDRTVDPPVPVHRDATLTLVGQAQEIINLVVISFLILEKKRRSKEAGEGTTASALATPLANLQ
ncbi:hypothetical protein JR316_0006034 [Psilocybe cubensis]|uniref:DUF6593 domain-containing protein n=2 Tax=Psilocybe cubensis TaxID=181762 RepID=A0A8H7Y303_PSICU|nr:hypothetical protein JR316_0006034 [Psilocybe cubensis]KAH9481507.1 hypothetical protein JR316_0006034 [Psilocybe cubensis]